MAMQVAPELLDVIAEESNDGAYVDVSLVSRPQVVRS